MAHRRACESELGAASALSRSAVLNASICTAPVRRMPHLFGQVSHRLAWEQCCYTFPIRAADRRGYVVLGLPHPSPLPPGEPQDHVAPPVGSADRERIAALLPGQTMRDLPEEMWHPSYRRRAYRRVQDGTPTERRGGAPAGLRRLRGDEPSRAITGASCHEFIHPVEDRPLTLREAARLQTFPDEFTFSGSKVDRQTLIGNAVPPLFASRIGDAVRAHLTEEGGNVSGKGALVRFHPTLADGMSPALADVVRMVTRRYLSGGELTLWD